MRLLSLRMAFFLFLFSFSAPGNQTQASGPPPETVSFVDLGRYQGVWYEIASFPQPFQQGCVATRAVYDLQKDGTLGVLNECRQDSFTGELRRVRGVAWPTDPSNAKLKVQLRSLGDYWIVALDPDYQWSVVSTPERDALWILNRERGMEPGLYRALVEQLKTRGFDTARLALTPQPRDF